jgi:hypothetical protein
MTAVAVALVAAGVAPVVASEAGATTPPPIDLLVGHNIDVGDVTVVGDGTNLHLQLHAASGYCLTIAHVAVAGSWQQIPQTTKGNPIPGRFPYKRSYDPCATGDEFVVALASIAGYQPGAPVTVAVHADVVVSATGDSQSAWAQGSGFPGANWSTYADVKLLPSVLGFDDIDLADGAEQPMPVGYGGFAWDQTGVFNPAVGRYGGYAVKSEPNLAFIAEAADFNVDGYPSPPGSPITALGSDYSFVGAWFSATYRDGLVITVTAYDDGVMVGRKQITATMGGPTWFAFDDPLDAQRFESIDRLELNANDGDPSTWDYFGMDDFTYFPSVN